jgi:hypothetical protein
MSRAKAKIRAKWANEVVEPVLAEKYTQGDLVGALNWYNTMTDQKTIIRYINTYLKKRKIEKVIPKSVSTQTAGAIMRMIDRDVISDPISEKYIKEFIGRLEDPVPVLKTVSKPELTIQQRTAIKLNDYITGLDNAFEDFLESDFKMKFNTQKYLSDTSIKSSYSDGLIVWMLSVRGEFQLSLTDKEMKEGYDNFTTPQKKKVIKFFDNMVSETQVYMAAIAPKRVKKSKSPEKVVAKVKYLQSFAELKLKSQSPEKLIDAKEVWLYNPHTKMLSYYSSTAGMTVKGTTLKGYDISAQRRIKKPIDKIGTFMKSRKGQWIKKFGIIDKTVISEGSGRLNDKTLILKVY